MKKYWPNLRVIIRIIAPVTVAALTVFYWTEIHVALSQALEVGPFFLLLFPLFWLWNHVATMGWKPLIRLIIQTKTPSIWHLSLIRLEAQSLNLLLPLAVAAPVLKTSLLAREQDSLVGSAASVTLDTIASTAAGIMFSVVALGVHRTLLPSNASSVWILVVAGFFLIAFLFFTPSLASGLGKLRWIDTSSSMGRTLATLADAGPPLKRALAVCLATHLIERVLMAFEIWIIAQSLGSDLDLSQTAFIGAIMTGFSLLFFFVPGQAGATEGSLALAFSLLGLEPTTGLSTALVRRARQLIVYGAGFLILVSGKSSMPRQTNPKNLDPLNETK